jgi:sugar lactone lactonase YvrE
MHARYLRSNLIFRNSINRERSLKGRGSSQNSEGVLDKSKFQDFRQNFPSSAESNRTHKGAKNTGNVKGQSDFNRIDSTFLPRFSSQFINISGKMKVLTLTNVKIELYKGTSLSRTIASSTSNDGSYQWTIPADLPDDSNYKIRISCVGEPHVYGVSDKFSIESKSITVTTPKSNSIWIKGNIGAIKWTTRGAITKVKIELYQKNSRVLTIVSNTQNDGIHEWTVSSSLSDGLDYKVRVSCSGEPDVFAQSEKFIITHGYKFVAKWGSKGSGAGKFDRPSALAIDNKGNVYVADTYNSRIQKFTSTGKFLYQWGGWPQLSWTQGVAVDKSNYVYVSDSSYARINKFTANGKLIKKWGSYGTGNYQFSQPKGLAVDKSGYVYVVDSWNHRIMKFTSNGTFITKWGKRGSGSGDFYYPVGIAVDKSGNIYVADNWNDRVQKFNSNGKFITEWGGWGTDNGEFNNPEGVAVDEFGFVYVADTWNDRIQKFTPKGKFITKWGHKGTGNGQFEDPKGIAVDSSGNVYVADSGNYRIQKFR